MREKKRGSSVCCGREREGGEGRRVREKVTMVVSMRNEGEREEEGFFYLLWT